jgi:Holliday junction resolvase
MPLERFASGYTFVFCRNCEAWNTWAASKDAAQELYDAHTREAHGATDMATEAALQARLLKTLRSWGGKWVRYPASSAFAEEGIPDILGTYRGFSVVIELKSPEIADPVAALSGLQKIALREYENAGAVCIVGNHFETILAELQSKTSKKARRVKKML